MGKRGPKPLSAAELEKRGSNLTKRRRAQEALPPPPPVEPPPAPTAQVDVPEELRHPTKPDWLIGDAATKWDEVVILLSKMKILTIADADVIATYCESWRVWRQASDTIAKEGFTTQSAGGSSKVHPAIVVRREAGTTLRALSDRLGLNPEARKALNVAAIWKPSQQKPPAAPVPTPETPKDTGPSEVIDGEEFFQRRSS